MERGGGGGGGAGKGGHAAWAKASPPHNTAQAYIHSITYTYFHTWRGYSSFAIRVDTTRGATSLDWCRAFRQGLLPTVGEILGSHWTVIARLKLGSPHPVRCCPATVCHPRWVHGDKGNRKSRLEPWHQATTNEIIKNWDVECPNNDDRLLRKSARHQDSRKTTVINDELKRLKLDIATLQETRLVDSGTLKEKDYTFF